MRSILARTQPMMLSILRIMTALLFLEHGLMKLFHVPVAQPGVFDPLPPLLLAAAVIETVAGALLVLGLFTRAVAFMTAGQMAAAYFVAHAPQGFWPGADGATAPSCSVSSSST